MRRTLAFRDTGKDRSSASGMRRAVSRLTDFAPTRDEKRARCDTSGYRARWEGKGGTKNMQNLSPSLRGCYADPIEVALVEHNERMPAVIEDPGSFETITNYTHDPSAWPKRVKVVTVCRKKRLRSFVLQPDELMAVFGDL